jgi:di/tricarboxylate transporter
MTFEQIFLTVVLVAMFTLFLWGKVRYDLVAFGGLVVTVIAGLIPSEDAFLGFGHPATVTVAAVLVLSRALSNSGVTEYLARLIEPMAKTTPTHIAGLSGIGGALSAFMNNVGALALLMPVAVQTALSAGRRTALVLMPLSFGSILGGLVTLIGTPPNVIIANYRAVSAGEPFGMFDFTPVGAVLAVSGILFVALIGWRLMPAGRSGSAESGDLLQIDNYIFEFLVEEESKQIDRTWREIAKEHEEEDIQALAIIRNGRRLTGFPRNEPLRAGDILLLETSAETADKFASATGLVIHGTEKNSRSSLESDDLHLMHGVVQARTRLDGRTVDSIRFRSRFTVRLLGVSRQGKPHRERLRHFRLRAGDVILLYGEQDHLQSAASRLGFLPLSGGGLTLGARNKALATVGVFVLAILLAALKLVALPIALGAAALATVLMNVVAPRDLYESIDWPVIVLLGAMIPVGGALEATGLADLAANSMASSPLGQSPVLALIAVFVVTMTVSDVLNNAATAVLMAPIAVRIATGLDVNPDAFLMAVAIGASCAFLTPIGHQNNALVMGPGGYRFGDYWRMGLPLEILLVAIGTPMILLVWPL